MVPWDPGLGPCDSPITPLAVASVPGPGAQPRWLCLAASPRLLPEEGECLGNGLKARVDSSFPGPDYSLQVAGCAVDISHSPDLHLKVVLRLYHQASLLGVILSRTGMLWSSIDCCLTVVMNQQLERQGFVAGFSPDTLLLNTAGLSAGQPLCREPCLGEHCDVLASCLCTVRLAWLSILFPFPWVTATTRGVWV